MNLRGYTPAPGEYGYKETRTGYVGYAGTCEVEQTEKGVVCKAIRDKGISDSLVMSAEQRAREINAEMERRDNDNLKRILDPLGDNTYHDPRNDAGVLGPNPNDYGGLSKDDSDDSWDGFEI